MSESLIHALRQDQLILVIGRRFSEWFGAVTVEQAIKDMRDYLRLYITPNESRQGMYQAYAAQQDWPRAAKLLHDERPEHFNDAMLHSFKAHPDYHPKLHKLYSLLRPFDFKQVTTTSYDPAISSIFDLNGQVLDWNDFPRDHSPQVSIYFTGCAQRTEQRVLPFTQIRGFDQTQGVLNAAQVT